MGYFTEMFCSDCQSSVSIKDTERWISLKCKCRCAIYYPSGHFAVIPKKVYLKNKEMDDENKEN